MRTRLQMSRPHSSNRYALSQELLRRARRLIPMATQTFSKSYLQFPVGVSPHFLSRGAGGRVWDADGNEYVDLVCGLLPVVLGYCDPDVDSAIRKQIDDGITFSLATELEIELAERLVEIVACAEMVRFGKNGTDATSAAIRIARASTGRDHVIVCGYHGWQDWSIGATTRNKGVPQAVRDLTHPVPYNDLDAVKAVLDTFSGEVAALIMEPMNRVDPAPGYLADLRDMVHAAGTIFIFDEIITGFRYALGGGQEYFDVVPDLAAFGKAMGNGMPISAIVGRGDLMREMEEIFFSATFGGEALSLAAAIAVIDKMRREPVIESIWRTGQRLAEGARERISRFGLSDTIELRGKAPWMLLEFHDHPNASKEAIKTVFTRMMLESGVLISASHNVCYAHDETDLRTVFAAYDVTLSCLAQELQRPSLDERIDTPLIQPVFEVR